MNTILNYTLLGGIGGFLIGCQLGLNIKSAYNMQGKRGYLIVPGLALLFAGTSAFYGYIYGIHAFKVRIGYSW